MPVFVFGRLLKVTERKKFFINFALSILNDCCGSIYNGFSLSNVPDISNDAKTVGIEVAATVIDQDVCMDNESEKYRLKSNTEMNESRNRQIMEPHGNMLDDSEKSIVQNIIQQKMKKVADYKKSGFKKIGLFIFLNEIPVLTSLETLKKYLNEVLNEYNEKYDIIYFGYLCGLIEYDVKKGNIKAQKIKIENYDRWQYEAKTKAEEEINDEFKDSLQEK